MNIINNPNVTGLSNGTISFSSFGDSSVSGVNVFDIAIELKQIQANLMILRPVPSDLEKHESLRESYEKYLLCQQMLKAAYDEYLTLEILVNGKAG